MEDRLLDKIAQPFNLQLPEYETMEAMIDEVLPAVKGFSEPNLGGDEPLLTKINWVKMTDKPGDTALRLYSFLPTGEISVAEDGKMSAMSYDVDTKNTKRIIIGQSRYRDSILYELAFLDNDFLILKRHGNSENLKKKYLFFCSEPIGTRLTWEEALEKLVGKYRDNQMPWLLILIVLLVILGVIVYFR
ncbi:MAG: hypothetical protein AAFZ52_02550 [Bacteroidota bacterium]